MTDVIQRAIGVAEGLAVGLGDARGYVKTDERPVSVSRTAEEARSVAEKLRQLGLLELLEEAFDHLAEDISHNITPDESDELATKIDETLRDAGYFETEMGERQE